ncbi:threonylcarbamoyl-AMP synthase [bacterium]|nr:threonylcarbamoyl-AMP synthase [bacterium]
MPVTSLLKVEFSPQGVACGSLEAIERAAAILTDGGLVAIPTETVYGLAGHALQEKAVSLIFQAKGRPSFNPLIVHVRDVSQAKGLVADWSASATKLTEAFWPGPLTIVLPKLPGLIPDRVTAGGQTVALRVPSHPVALQLLRAIDFPLAAPSANRSEALSPTTAEHVWKSLEGRVDLILDAGPTGQGIESTVVDLSGPPRILRPGPVSSAEIEAIIGPLEGNSNEGDETLRSPGMLARHYAPRAPLRVLDDPASIRQSDIKKKGVVWIAFDGEDSLPEVATIFLPKQPSEYRRSLYAALHQADEMGATLILVSRPPEGPDWEGVRDRLSRAEWRQ